MSALWTICGVAFGATFTALVLGEPREFAILFVPTFIGFVVATIHEYYKDK